MKLEVRHPAGSYPVIVKEGALSELGSRLRELGFEGALTLVADDRVAALHGASVTALLDFAGFEVELLSFPEGEASKNLETVQDLYEDLARIQHPRGRPILALGGGVVGDLVGFVAATWMRGVPLVQLPTTLLSMVDSSVGGKVAVDLPQGKNLVGAFKQPEMVLADPDLLLTLDEEQKRQGLAELIKHAIISGGSFFENLEAGATLDSGLIASAIEIKAEIVEEDPFEMGRRRLLNLGHSFGHAFELLSGYALPHGEAIARGCGCAARLALARGLCDEASVRRIEAVFLAFGLPIRGWSCDGDELLDAMALDKKIGPEGQIRLVLPRAPGDVVVRDGATAQELKAAL